MRRPFHDLRVFTSEGEGGNPLAVVLGPLDLGHDQMLEGEMGVQPDHGRLARCERGEAYVFAVENGRAKARFLAPSRAGAPCAGPARAMVIDWGDRLLPAALRHSLFGREAPAGRLRPPKPPRGRQPKSRAR